MAHFARLDKYGYVADVIVVSNEDISDENGNENESVGVDFCKKLFGGGEWVQTSYNSNFRNKYASPGDYYNKEKDIFI